MRTEVKEAKALTKTEMTNFKANSEEKAKSEVNNKNDFNQASEVLYHLTHQKPTTQVSDNFEDSTAFEKPGNSAKKRTGESEDSSSEYLVGEDSLNSDNGENQLMN